jgi:hypothetical protein
MAWPTASLKRIASSTPAPECGSTWSLVQCAPPDVPELGHHLFERKLSVSRTVAWLCAASVTRQPALPLRPLSDWHAPMLMTMAIRMAAA